MKHYNVLLLYMKKLNKKHKGILFSPEASKKGELKSSLQSLTQQ